ncbi:hypothetical protein EDD15DRAFT_2192689 [Pisolithus albus]|nr:hypothetical protein EDD15DRAFT_2192689 [Pisolithus albus]
MKFVKNSKELGVAVNRILSTYERLVVTSGTMESAERHKRWREAVKEMRNVLESVRAIADRTDNVPPTLIGVDKFIHWTDDIGNPGVPFPDWPSSLFPTPASIAGHPWLLTVESRFDATRAGWMVRLESPTATPVLVRVPTPPVPENQPAANVAPSHPESADKGKEKALPAESQAIGQQPTSRGDGNEDGESEVVEPDVPMDDQTSEPVCGRSKKSPSQSRPTSTRRKSQSRPSRSGRKGGENEVVGLDVPMDDQTSEPVRGRSNKRARSPSQSRPTSTRRKSQSRARRSGTKGGEDKGEGTSTLPDAETTPKPKYGRAQVAARTTPPPDPNACSTCVNRKVVCTWTVGNIPCDPCKKRKIGCGKGSARRASMARTPKTPAKRQATPTPPNSPRPRTPVPPQVDDNATQPPRKKARISKRAQNPPNQGEGSSSSAPQRRVTVVIRPPQPPEKKHAVPPTIRDEVSARIPLPAPPIPPSHEHSPPLQPMPQHPSNTSWDRRLDDIIQRQDLIFGRLDEVDRRVEDVARRIPDHREDRLLALEGQLADCRLTIGTLTREVETLRASVHGNHPARVIAPPPVDQDLLDVFGPSEINATTEEAEESVAAQLPCLVVTETQTGQELGTRGQQEPSLAAQVEEESSSVHVGNETSAATGDSSSAQDGSGSGEASTGHQEEGGSGGASADISSAQDGTGGGEASAGHVEASGDISSAQDGGGSGEASTGHAEASGDSSSPQVDSGRGEASTGHAEEGGSEKH